MALFPRCDLQVRLGDGYVRAGARLLGSVELDVPDDIPRAEAVELYFRTRAWAGYGSGKSRSVVRRDVLAVPLRFELAPGAALPRGHHSHPFAIDIPAWLPPGYAGNDCAIEHQIEARVDVDWAKDPVARWVPVVLPAPVQGVRSPATLRSAPGFHDRIVLEIALASSTITQGEPIQGTIALRGGHDARFDAIRLAHASRATISMGRKDARYREHGVVRIPADALRPGAAVAFHLPPLAPGAGMPTFRNGFIDHDVVLRIAVDIPWAIDPSFDVPLLVLPQGSTLAGHGDVVALGVDRLRQISRAMADASGLRPGGAGRFVEGELGPVAVCVSDDPRGGRLGVELTLDYPDLGLGIAFRRLGMLGGLRSSPLLPPRMAQDYSLRLEAHGPERDERGLAAFVAAMLGDLGGSDEVRFSDRQLAMHVPLASDDVEPMVAVARFARDKARAIGEAILALPFPVEVDASCRAWRAAAEQEEASLVPSRPSLHGLVLRARLVDGDERVLRATLETVWQGGQAATRAELDLRGVPLPEDARQELLDGSDRLGRVRETFPEAEVASAERVALLREGFTADPRTLLPALSDFLGWLLEARGERRADQPYR